MTEKYDLHCHSTVSDGLLSPSQLIERAGEQGVTTLALTDHDTTAGYEEACLAAKKVNIRLIEGIELSATWQGMTFHILGLGINSYHEPLLAATRHLQTVRIERAEKISDKLKKKHITGAFEAVIQAAGETMITRSHFADFLVSQHHVSTHQEAFDRYLAKGKPAYVPTVWADMELAVDWINQSGGIAVLAHPLRYQLTTKWMKRFLTAFKQAGGKGIEVVTGRCNNDEINRSAKYAQEFTLVGSVGSDFHSPENKWIELGRLAPLPSFVKPVWELLS